MNATSSIPASFPFHVASPITVGQYQLSFDSHRGKFRVHLTCGPVTVFTTSLGSRRAAEAVYAAIALAVSESSRRSSGKLPVFALCPESPSGDSELAVAGSEDYAEMLRRTR